MKWVLGGKFLHMNKQLRGSVYSTSGQKLLTCFCVLNFFAYCRMLGLLQIYCPPIFHQLTMDYGQVLSALSTLTQLRDVILISKLYNSIIHRPSSKLMFSSSVCVFLGLTSWVVKRSCAWGGGGEGGGEVSASGLDRGVVARSGKPLPPAPSKRAAWPKMGSYCTERSVNADSHHQRHC